MENIIRGVKRIIFLLCFAPIIGMISLGIYAQMITEEIIVYTSLFLLIYFSLIWIINGFKKD